MKILAIDTSSPVASAAVACDGRLLGESIISNGKTHSQIIILLIDDMLKKAGVPISDIDVFASTLGPGSFTGLRIGVATAKAFAQSHNKKVIGVSSLQALSCNVPYNDGVAICPIIDARRGNVYNAVYKDGVTVKGDRLVSLDTVLEEMKAEKTIFLGDGVLKHKDKIIEKMGDNAIFLPDYVTVQRASSVAHLAYLRAVEDDFDSIYSMQPIYVRPSQAERELNGD